MNNPEITIILTTYNGGVRGYLNKAILSVINQSFKNFEFIIVDDGSTDNTERICKKYSDDRIIFVKKENGGIGSARNFGIKLSRGSFICFLDDDDFWLRSSKYYHFFSIKEYVVNYRLHKKQETDSRNYKEQQAECLITINRILEAEQYKKRKKVLKNFFLNLLIFFFK